MKRATVLLSSLLISGPLLVPGALAAEWERGAGISLGTFYSDNICLSDTQREGRAAATITPNLFLRGQGARANLSLQGSVRYDSLADSDLDCTGAGAGAGGTRFTNRQSLVPSLRFLGDLELIEDWLTLESDASATTNRIDPFAPGGADAFDGRDNVNITYRYGAGATIQRRLFGAADLRLRYHHNEQSNAVGVLSDSSEDRGEFDLDISPGGSRLSMGISARHSEVSFDGDVNRPAFDNTLSSAEVTLGLQLSASWQINGLAGEEWNEFDSVRPDVDGSFWDVGLRWSPNSRVEVEVGTGERFFGSTPRASVRYRHKRSEVTVDYARTLTFPRNLRAPGGFIDPRQLPDGPTTVDGEPTFTGDSPIINERLSVQYRFSARRTTVTISAADSRQERTEEFSDATFSNVGLTISRSLSSALSANAGVNWSQREGQGGTVGFFGGDSETWRGSLGLNRRLGNNTSLNLSLQHTRRESDGAFNQFEENRITLSASHQF